MVIRIRFGKGPKIGVRRRKNRRAALVLSALLTPAAAMAFALALLANRRRPELDQQLRHFFGTFFALAGLAGCGGALAGCLADPEPLRA